MAERKWDWAMVEALGRLAVVPWNMGIDSPVVFVVTAATLTTEARHRWMWIAAALRERYAWREKCARLRKKLRDVTIDRDEWLAQHENLLGVLAKTNELLADRKAEVEQLRSAIVEVARRPSLLLNPEVPLEVAWIAIGVDAGVISVGKARELLGGLGIFEWMESKAARSQVAMRLVQEAIDGIG